MDSYIYIQESMPQQRRQSRMFSISNIFYIPLLGILFVYIINTFIGKSHIFSEEDIIRITRENIDSKANIGDTIQAIHKDLFARYPNYVVPRDDLEFMFLSAGGWNCAIYFLHASLSETIFIYGTLLDSSGHSGRNWLNKTDVLIKGELTAWKEGSQVVETFRAGDVFRYYSGEAYILGFKADMWKLTYLKGFIPFVLPYITTQNLLINHDYQTLFKIYKFLIKAFYQQIVISIKVFITP